MLPDPNRMRSRDEFRSAVRCGRRAGRPLLVVHLSEDDFRTEPRVGFVVSRAVGNAVVRNRVRRRLRHLMRRRLARVPSDGLLVVRANKASAAASFAELGTDLDRALDRVLRAEMGSRR